jgi:hypothetical protein
MQYLPLNNCRLSIKSAISVSQSVKTFVNRSVSQLANCLADKPLISLKVRKRLFKTKIRDFLRKINEFRDLQLKFKTLVLYLGYA